MRDGLIGGGNTVAKSKKKKRSRKKARSVDVPKKALSHVSTALGAVRRAKGSLPPGRNRAAFRELHNVESRLTRIR